MLALILVVAAFLLALIAAFNVPSRANLIAASLACYFLSLLVGHLGLH